jgi:hypothetical protein
MAIFVPIVFAIVVLGLVVRAVRLRHRDDWPEFDGGSVHDAAEAALGYLDRQSHPLASLARASGGATGWFEDSLRRILPGRRDDRVSAKELRDYLRWARSVQ